CTGMHPEGTERPPKTEPPPELPFDPSPDDKAAFDVAGYVGTMTMPADTGFAKGCRVFGVKPKGFAEAAGLRANDGIVEVAGVTFAATDDDPIGKLRERLLQLPFDSDTQVKFWREKEGVREVTVHLGRRPPPFASHDTPAWWLAAPREPVPPDGIPP